MLAFAGTDPARLADGRDRRRILLDPATHTHRGFQAAIGAPEVTAGVDRRRRDEPAGPASRCSSPATASARRSAILAAQHAAQRHNFPPRRSTASARRGSAAPVPRRVQRVAGGGDRRLGEVTYRLVHGRDIVARVPMFLGYRHVGRVLACDSNAKFGERNVSDGLTDDPLFSDAVMDEIKGLLRGGDVLGFFQQVSSQARPKTPQRIRRCVLQEPAAARTRPAGRDWLRLLPPQIREHLQDRYIAALAP